MVAQVETPIGVESPPRYSPQEYLAIEVESEERHEYRDGEIVLMAGATPNHNRVTLNVASLFNFAFKRQPYEVFSVDQRLWIPKNRLYTYPDILVIQDELEFHPDRKDTVMNPLLIVEVLSKSTADYDKQEKFRAYRSIPSFQEYLLIDQHSYHLEHYIKTSAKRWIFQEYDDTDTVVQLATVGLEVAIADIYDKVKLAAEAAEMAETE
jgi:Uma2 family endonuclease